MPKILSSAPVIDHFKASLQENISNLKKKNITPSLKILLIGNSPASLIYTKNKKKFSESIGAQCEIIQLDENISSEFFFKKIKEISEDQNCHGLLVQLPLPHHLNQLEINELIPKEKDVDGFHAANLYNLMAGTKRQDDIIPCTPKGIMTLLNFYNLDVARKNIVIVGRSLIVGKPLANLLCNYNATISLCHSMTSNLEEFTKKADFIITAIGKPKFLGPSFFSEKKMPVVIDVGINKLADGSICGDVDFERVKELTSAITPVPGGVGPLTILSLAQNLIILTENSLKSRSSCK